jgi:DNA-binding MarR family transcriptional regulator
LPKRSWAYRCERQNLVMIRNQFEALGLIKPEGSSSGSSAIAWTLTEKGRRYYASETALRRN